MRATLATIPVAPSAALHLPLRTLLSVTALFWLYVTVSDVLYAQSLQIEVAKAGGAAVFGPWQQRVLQHALLFPLLLGCYWLALRVGWSGLWRAAVQVLLGAAFATLSFWAMVAAILLIARVAPAPGGDGHPESIAALWFASFVAFLLSYGFGLALVLGLALYRRFHDAELRMARLEREWSAARLTALRLQLSPHTLFNLLHTIRGLIDWQPGAARAMTVQFADLLRRSLNASERDFSPLSEELRFARLYLELQQQRFGERLAFTLPDVSAQPALWVPSLILQPLIENAVTHGLVDHDGRVGIRVETSLSADQLRLRVINSTAGARAPSAAGIGLRNVRERLAVHFGDRATLASDAADAQTWVATLVLPAVRDHEARAA